VIVLLSPDGLMGLWGRLGDLRRRGARPGQAPGGSERGSGELEPTV
jgi:hypothetical protein